MRKEIDLGDGHRLEFFGWHPDRSLNPQFEHLPDVETFSAWISHSSPKTGEDCVSAITFDAPVARQLVQPKALWQVLSWDPLTVDPSILCLTCGDHGHIRQGKWVRA
jgi:hypothetical protein